MWTSRRRGFRKQMAGDPTLAEVIREAISSRLLDVHTALPGRVRTYDRAKQVADIEVMILHPAPMADGDIELETYPVIPNVPVGWMRGGGYSLQFPLNKGDSVWLIFSEACMAHWRVSGQVSEPGDLRRHDLSYPIAIPCCAPDADALTAIGADEAVIDGPTLVRLGGSSSQFLAVASLVLAELAAMKTKFDAHTHLVATTGTAVAQSGTAAAVVTIQQFPVAGSIGTTKLKAE